MTQIPNKDLPKPLQTPEPEPAPHQELMPAPSRAQTLNPFENERKNVAATSSAGAEVHRAVAEVQAAIMLAKQFPRDKVEAVDRILVQCTRISLAESAIYSYPKGGQEITGPSIRLAEVIAQNWGNFQFGWDELNRQGNQSEILAFAWDVETNVRRTMKFFVKHWRDTKKGGYAIKDERDIYELCANQAQRRVRACILNTIPGDVVEAAVNECERTLTMKSPCTPEAIKKLLAAFEKIGVSKAQIEKRLGRKVEAESMNGAIMAQLRKIYAGIRDGMSEPEEFFEPELPSELSDSAKDSSSKSPEPSDWDSVIDELIFGLQGCADQKTIDAYMEEIADQIKTISQKAGPTACTKWARAYAKRCEELAPTKK